MSAAHGGGPWALACQDVARYGGWRALWREQSLWAVLWYRLGCLLALCRPAPLRRLALLPWWLGFRVLEMLVGVSIPLGARIGGGLRVWHLGGVFLHDHVVIGRNCTLRQGVTIGNRREAGGAPVLGNDVELGAYAQVLGAVHIGDGARIGALSVVLNDVPPGHTAVGAPARVIAPARRGVGMAA
jgi:serine O-acetyltransferase